MYVPMSSCLTKSTTIRGMNIERVGFTLMCVQASTLPDSNLTDVCVCGVGELGVTLSTSHGVACQIFKLDHNHIN